MSDRGARPTLLAVGALATALCVAGCGESGSARARPDPRRFLTVDAPAREARITLIAGYNENGAGLNINGSVKGALLFSVPTGWRLKVDCVNRSSTAYYSCALARSPGAPSPQQGLLGVLHPASGLPPGGSASFTLPLRAGGLYRLVAVTGTAAAYTIPTGMWALLRVSAGGAPYARWRR